MRLPVIIIALAFASCCLNASAAIIIWNEDFVDVNNWTVIFDQNGGSTITSDGNLGLFNVPSANNETAFGPIPLSSPLVLFQPNSPQDYNMAFTVDSVSWSMSYDIRLDQFDANTNNVGTVFGVYPQGTFVGATNINLGAFTFNGSAVFLLPKITVFTGDGGQVFKMDNINFTSSVVPEPSTLLLFLGGMGVIWMRRKYRVR
jgi:hypothetical protein